MCWGNDKKMKQTYILNNITGSKDFNAEKFSKSLIDVVKHGRALMQLTIDEAKKKLIMDSMQQVGDIGEKFKHLNTGVFC